jgi:hypothetical protein
MLFIISDVFFIIIVNVTSNIWLTDSFMWEELPTGETDTGYLTKADHPESYKVRYWVPSFIPQYLVNSSHSSQPQNCINLVFPFCHIIKSGIRVDDRDTVTFYGINVLIQLTSTYQKII